MSAIPRVYALSKIANDTKNDNTSVTFILAKGGFTPVAWYEHHANPGPLYSEEAYEYAVEQHKNWETYSSDPNNDTVITMDMIEALSKASEKK